MQFLSAKKMKPSNGNWKEIRYASLYAGKAGSQVFILTSQGEGAPCAVAALPPFPSRRAGRAWMAHA